MKLKRCSLKFILSFIVSLVIFSACHQDKSAEDGGYLSIPDPKTLGESYVSNPDKILSESTVTSLNTVLSTLDQSGRAHIDVVIVETIGDAVPKDAVTALFRKWKIGDKKTNNGLLMLVVKDQHRIEFETGYGLEGDLPDLVCYRIQQKYMIPHARNNDFDSAVQDGVNGLIAELKRTSEGTGKASESMDDAIAVIDDSLVVHENDVPPVEQGAVTDSAAKFHFMICQLNSRIFK